MAAVGKPYLTLIEDLEKDSRYAPLHLMDAAKLPPTVPGGLNIEGLAASAQGELLIGFRNPIPEKKALIATLKNPWKVLSGAKPAFDAPILLDLEGRGIRSLEYWPAGKAYVISAGSFEDGGTFQAFRWSGRATDKPKLIADLDFGTMIPEAIFFDPAAPNELVVLSDDGDFCPTPSAFRSRRIKLAVE